MTSEEVRSIAFWAYKKERFIFDKTPGSLYWGNNDMVLCKSSQKVTEIDFEKMEYEAITWNSSTLIGPNVILEYLYILEKEIGTFKDPVEDKSIGKYIAITIFDFFKAWRTINFSYKVFMYSKNSQTTCRLGVNYISPATKLKFLYNKYNSFLEEPKKVEFEKLISEFKNVFAIYKNTDLEAQKQILVNLEKRKEELERELEVLKARTAFELEAFTKNLPNSYDEIWPNRLN